MLITNAKRQMTRWTITLLLTAVFASTVLFGQTDKKKIISSFDKVEYYPNSIIKCAYKIKKGLYNGYAIEFDSTGQVKAIGKYKKGLKTGTWQFRYCTYTTYKKGQQGLISVINYDYIPEKQKAINDFNNFYYKLIHSDKKSRVLLKP